MVRAPLDRAGGVSAPCAGRERRDRAPRPCSRARYWTSGASCRRARRASGSSAAIALWAPAPGGGGHARDRAVGGPGPTPRLTITLSSLLITYLPAGATVQSRCQRHHWRLVAAVDERVVDTLMAVSYSRRRPPAASRTWPPSCAWTAGARRPTAAGSGHPTRCASARLRRGDLLHVMRFDPQRATRSGVRSFRAEQGHAAPRSMPRGGGPRPRPQGPRAATSDRQRPRGPPHAAAAVRWTSPRARASGARVASASPSARRMLGTDARGVRPARRRRDGRGLRVGAAQMRATRSREPRGGSSTQCAGPVGATMLATISRPTSGASPPSAGA